MTWDIVVGIIALVSAVIAVGKIISNNTRTMTELKCSIDSLSQSFGTQRADLKDAQATLADHEARLIRLESKD